EDVLVGGLGLRCADLGHTREGLVVEGGMMPARLAPGREMRKLREQDRSLKRVEPAVGPDFLVMVLLGAAVQPEFPEPGGEGVILGDDHSTVSPGPEILAREEGKAARCAQLSG